MKNIKIWKIRREKKYTLEKKNTASCQKECVSAGKKKKAGNKKYRLSAKGVSEWVEYLFQGKKKYDTFA